MLNELLRYLCDNHNNGINQYYVEMKPIKEFEEFLKIANLFYYDNCKEKTGWIFRGEKEYSRELENDLERQLNRWGIPISEAENIENKLFYQFKRRYQSYSIYKPDDEKLFEWLTIMRHYTCPTRLIDFTYSIYIALFWAIYNSAYDNFKQTEKCDECKPKNKCSVIWAINQTWVGNIYRKMNKKYDKEIQKDSSGKSIEIEKSMFNFKQKSIVSHNSYILNDRLSKQQGVFLFCGNVNTTFVENIQAVLANVDYDCSKSHSENIKLYKLTFCTNERFMKDAFSYLKYFGISSETMFESNLEHFCNDLKAMILNYDSLL